MLLSELLFLVLLLRLNSLSLLRKTFWYLFFFSFLSTLFFPANKQNQSAPSDFFIEQVSIQHS